MFTTGIEANKKASQAFDDSGNPFMKLVNGTNLFVPLQPMTEVVGFLKHNIWTDPQVHHLCIGEDEGCPGCKNDVPTSKQFSLVVKEEGEGKAAQVLVFGTMILNQLITNYELDPENFVGRVFAIERTGVKKSTRYQTSGTMRMEDVAGFDSATFPDIRKLQGPTDVDKVAELYTKGGDDTGKVMAAM